MLRETCWKLGPVKVLCGVDLTLPLRETKGENEGHLDVNNRPAYRSSKRVRSEPHSQVSSVRTADVCLSSDTNEHKAPWVCQAWMSTGFLGLGTLSSCKRGTLQAGSFQLLLYKRWILIQPLTKVHLSYQVREAVARSNGRKVAGICNTGMELLKNGSETTINGDACSLDCRVVICCCAS